MDWITWAGLLDYRRSQGYNLEFNRELSTEPLVRWFKFKKTDGNEKEEIIGLYQKYESSSKGHTLNCLLDYFDIRIRRESRTTLIRMLKHILASNTNE
jgi:hypothetical protein